QDVRGADVAEVTDDDGTRARVICGSFWGVRGPVDGIAAEPSYVDVWVPPGRRRVLPIETSRHAFAYVFEGSGRFANASEPREVKTDGLEGLGAVPAGGQEAGKRTLGVFD